MLNLIRMVFACMVVTCVIVAGKCFKKRNAYGRQVGMVMFFGAIINMCYLLLFFVDGYFFSSFISSIEFISIDLFLSFLLTFVFHFTHLSMSEKMIRYGKDLMQLSILLDIAMMAVNPFFELSVTYTPIYDLGVTVYQYQPNGICFFYHLLICFVLAGLIFVLLFKKAKATPKIYRLRYQYLLYSIVVLVLLNVAYLVVRSRIQLDYSVFLYGFSGILLFLLVFYVPQDRIIKEARNLLLNHFGRAVAVFDYENRLIDYNKEMSKIFPTCSLDNERFFEELVQEYHLPLKDVSYGFDWRQFVNRRQHVFRCEYECFYDGEDSNGIIGRSLIMMDITFAKDPITNLESTSGLYEFLFNHRFDESVPTQIAVFNIVSLGIINKAFGYDNGNYIMMRLADQVKELYQGNAYYAKTENGCIVAVISNMTLEEVERKANVLCGQRVMSEELNIEYSIEFGLAKLDKTNLDSIEILQEAYDSLKNKKLLNRLSQSSSLIHSLQQTLLESDYETEEHAMRTKEHAVELARRLALSEKEVSQIALLALLHDIGKISIPHNILRKPGKLDEQEWMIMKSHCEKGYRIAKASNELMPIADYILHHHERWDGTGYPHRLKGTEIPILDRILTVVDSFDVMTHDRPYHVHISQADAIMELKRCSGTQFDPDVVRIFIEMLEERK